VLPERLLLDYLRYDGGLTDTRASVCAARACTLLHPGEVAIEVVPAGVVVADQPTSSTLRPVMACLEPEATTASHTSRASGCLT
jgi:hypothetical protein